MTEYNISSFIRLMRGALIENNTQEHAARFLLDAIDVNEYMDLSSTMITHLVKQNREVPDAIKKASAKREVIANAIHYFEDVVMPDLNPHLKDDLFWAMITLLKTDSSVSTSKADELSSLYYEKKSGEFLARSFLYAVSKQNKQVGTVAEVDDVPLLLEVHNKCPLCHDPLVKSIKEQSIRKYQITKIDAEKGRVSHNKIALCVSCALEHQVTRVEIAEELADVKEEALKYSHFQEKMAKVSLEFEIRDVILELVNRVSHIEQATFKLDVMKLDEKILPENVFLLSNLKADVLKYYRFIENMLSKANIYEDVALDMRKAYQQIQKVYPAQDDVAYYLSDWIFSKTNLFKPAHRRACDIIVAFFVQNCEVFDAISR